MSQDNSAPDTPGGSTPPSGHHDPREMGFFEHLEELRSRLIKCLWIFMLGFGAAYGVSDHIMGFLKAPLFAVLPEDQRKLVFTTLFENFMAHLKISGVASLFVFSPYFFYQLWAFVAPGLYPKERKLVIPFITAATGFFIAGAAFAYFVLFPVGFKFFVTYGTKEDVAMLTIDGYYTTVLKLLLLFGLAFELPVLITLFGYLGLVDSKMLRENRRTAIVGITVIAALFAPPDAISMIILGAPLVLMYEGAIIVVHWIGLKRNERLRAEAEAGTQSSGEPPHDPFNGQSKP